VALAGGAKPLTFNELPTQGSRVSLSAPGNLPLIYKQHRLHGKASGDCVQTRYCNNTFSLHRVVYVMSGAKLLGKCIGSVAEIIFYILQQNNDFF